MSKRKFVVVEYDHVDKALAKFREDNKKLIMVIEDMLKDENNSKLTYDDIEQILKEMKGG